MEKTNVIRIIERKKLKYNYHFYNPETVNGAEVAAFLKEDPERVFKTLVTVGKSNKNYVFMVHPIQSLAASSYTTPNWPGAMPCNFSSETIR